MMKSIKLYVFFIILIYAMWMIIVIKYLYKNNKYKEKILSLEKIDFDEEKIAKLASRLVSLTKTINQTYIKML